MRIDHTEENKLHAFYAVPSLKTANNLINKTNDSQIWENLGDITKIMFENLRIKKKRKNDKRSYFAHILLTYPKNLTPDKT